MDIEASLLLLLIGIIAGGYGTIVGAGGGFIYVPALLLLFNMKPAIAAGSGLVIVFINSFSATFGYIRQQKVDYRTGILIAIGAFPGSIIGIWLLHVHSSHYFFTVFATILVFLGIFLFIKNISFRKVDVRVTNKDSKFNSIQNDTSPFIFSTTKEKYYLSFKLLLPLGILMGTLSSYLGIGGGWLLVPILIYVFKFPTHNATATSIFSLCIYSSYGIVSQILYNSIDWPSVLWGSLGIIVGSQVGVKLSQHIPSKIIMQMLSILLIIIGIRMYFE